MQPQPEHQKPAPILVKLLFSIVVKQCITAPEDNNFLNQHCQDPAIKEVLLKLFKFNQILVQLTEARKDLFGDTKHRSWGDKHLYSALMTYSSYLLSLGFTVEEQIELFPDNTPLKKLLSLKEQIILKVRFAQLQIKNQKKPPIKNLETLPQDLQQLISNEDYIFTLAKQHYINHAGDNGKIPQGLESDAKDKLKIIFNTPVQFRANGNIEKPKVRDRLLSLLLNLLYIPENQWLLSKELSLLHIATYGPSYIYEKIITMAEFDENLRTLSQDTILHLATDNQNVPVVQVIIKHLRDKLAIINAVKDDNTTALHIAAYKRNLELVTALVEAGANLDCQTTNGYTALHLANIVSNRGFLVTDQAYEELLRYPLVTEYLLNAGADSEILNNQGETAYEMYLIPFVRGFTRIMGYQSETFEQYYKKKADENIFLYTNQLDDDDSINLLLNALRQSRGVVFFREFAKKYPNKIREFRDDQLNNIVHIICEAIERQPRRRYINPLLIKVVTDNFPELFAQKNSQGRNGITQLNTVTFHYNEKEQIFDQNEYLRQNTSPQQRYGIMLLALAIYVSIALMGSGYMLSSLSDTGIFLPIGIILGLLPIVYALTPTHYWSSLKDMVVQALTRLANLPTYLMNYNHGPLQEPELREIIIEGGPSHSNSEVREELEPINIHYANPTGIDYRKLKSKEDKTTAFQLELTALLKYAEKSKDESPDLNESLILESFIDQLKKLHANTDGLSIDSRARMVLSFIDNNKSYLTSDFLNNLDKYLQAMRLFCSVDDSDEIKRNYGTCSNSR